MSNWFTNRGQMIQVFLQFVGTCAGLYIAFPNLMSKGVEAFSVVWPVLTIPLFVGILWVLFEKWYIPMLDRMSAKAFADRFPEFRDAEVDNTKPPPTN